MGVSWASDYRCPIINCWLLVIGHPRDRARLHDKWTRGEPTMLKNFVIDRLTKKLINQSFHQVVRRLCFTASLFQLNCLPWLAWLNVKLSKHKFYFNWTCRQEMYILTSLETDSSRPTQQLCRWVPIPHPATMRFSSFVTFSQLFF